MKISLSVLFLMCININVFADANLASDVSSVMEMRQEIERLSNEVEIMKKTNQSLLDVYVQREQELEGQLLSENFKRDQVNVQIQAVKEKIFKSQSKIKQKNESHWLANFWQKYELTLESANPLYSKSLKERLVKVKLDFKDQRLSYEHALLQTWFLVEDDFKKSQDTEYYIAPLMIDNNSMNLEMVRLGRNNGFFKTANGKYGLLNFENGWKIKYFEDSNSQEQIRILLSQYKQQQKTGLFTIPGSIK